MLPIAAGKEPEDGVNTHLGGDFSRAVPTDAIGNNGYQGKRGVRTAQPEGSDGVAVFIIPPFQPDMGLDGGCEVRPVDENQYGGSPGVATGLRTRLGARSTNRNPSLPMCTRSPCTILTPSLEMGV